MRTRLVVIGLVVWPFLAAAQGMTVDGSTKETYERSIKAMAEGMSAEDREAFGRGLMNLIVTRYPPAQGAQGFAIIPLMGPALEAAHITLDGVSKEEILSKGREIIASDTAHSSSNIAKAPLDAAHEEINITRSCVQKNVIIKNAIIEKESFGRHISIEVTNELPWAISGIRVEYIAMSAGRSVPWAKDDFSLSISGGIEPGETRTLRANDFEVPNDAPDKLIVESKILDVADPLNRQLIQDVRVIGWSEEKSPMTCK